MRVVTGFFLLVLLCPRSAAGQWRLIWSDEFNGPANTPPDVANWVHDRGDGGWGNRELEVYTDDSKNAFQDGQGHLVVRAIKTGVGRYTSARLKTKGKFDFLYGRIAARMRLPDGQGLWPAFWLLGSNYERSVPWPECGEIDVMESRGQEPWTVHGTIHGPGYSGTGGISFAYRAQHAPPLSHGFHIYSAEWSPHRIAFFVDGRRYGEITPSSLPHGARWVFDHPLFILLNLAVGGTWPGSPDDSTVFPQSMVVDWVRVWQRID